MLIASRDPVLRAQFAPLRADANLPARPLNCREATTHAGDRQGGRRSVRYLQTGVGGKGARARACVCDLRVVRGWVGGWGGVLSEHTYSSST